MTAILIVTDFDAKRVGSYPSAMASVLIETVDHSDAEGVFSELEYRTTCSVPGCAAVDLDGTAYGLADLIEYAEAHVARHEAAGEL